MKKDIEKSEWQEITLKYQESKKWHSEIETGESGIRFIKDMIFKFLTKIDDENKLLETRMFYNKLDGTFKGRLEWLVQKLEIHQERLKSYIKKSHYRNHSEIQIQHNFFEKEVAQLRENYSEIRTDFFKLIKPTLRKRRTRRRVTNAA